MKKENFKWYVDEIWGWKDKDQKERLEQDLKEHLNHKRIILVDDKTVGIYAVHTTQDGDLFINEISILKGYQNKEIGKKILEEQLKENHRGSEDRPRNTIEEQCVADADVIAHFDCIPSLFSLVYKEMNLSILDGKEYVRRKLERDYNKLSPRTRELLKDRYKNIVDVLFIN